MTIKSRRNTTKTRGRGNTAKNKGGSKGGKSTLATHKRFKQILALKKLEKQRKSTNIRDIESKLDRLIKKKIILKKVQKTELGFENLYTFTPKFASVYSKILAEGQPSGKYIISKDLRKKLKVSKNVKIKCC